MVILWKTRLCNFYYWAKYLPVTLALRVLVPVAKLKKLKANTIDKQLTRELVGGAITASFYDINYTNSILHKNVELLSPILPYQLLSLSVFKFQNSIKYFEVIENCKQISRRFSI